MPKKIPETIKDDIKYFVKSEVVQGKVSKISMRYIAENLGIGTGTIYNYYSSKEDIYFEIAKDEWHKNILSRVVGIKGKDLKEKLKNILVLFYDFHINMENLMVCIDEKDKYYLFFTLFKKMSDVAFDELFEEVKNILKSENIEFDYLKCKMITDYIKFGFEYKKDDLDEIAENLSKLVK